MNFVEDDKEEGDELEGDELEEEAMITTSNLPFSSLPSSSSSSTQYRNFMFPNQNPRDQHQNPSLSFSNKLELIDLSLGNEIGPESKNNKTASGSSSIEKEHMFDKVVTPSDVGKLNRLVIPKQHAERFFPLDSNSNEKGLLLNFEDRNGKPWRFRYSYWNSSQSYVMTKGWSRFVKEKKLDAGDIVSFQRGVGESARHNLYIDWRRRPSAPDPTSLTQFELQNQLQFPPRWGRLYSLPQPFPRPPYDYGAQPYHRHYNFPPPPANYVPAVSQQYYLRPTPAQFGGFLRDRDQVPMVIDSIPVVHGRSVGKRLRLFGVNMECSDDQNQSPSSSDSMPISGSFSHHHVISSSFQLPQRGNSGEGSSIGGGAPISAAEDDSKKGKSSKSSLSFDLDI